MFGMFVRTCKSFKDLSIEECYDFTVFKSKHFSNKFLPIFMKVIFLVIVEIDFSGSFFDG